MKVEIKDVKNIAKSKYFFSSLGINWSIILYCVDNIKWNSIDLLRKISLAPETNKRRVMRIFAKKNDHQIVAQTSNGLELHPRDHPLAAFQVQRRRRRRWRRRRRRRRVQSPIDLPRGLKSNEEKAISQRFHDRSSLALGFIHSPFSAYVPPDQPHFLFPSKCKSPNFGILRWPGKNVQRRNGA